MNGKRKIINCSSETNISVVARKYCRKYNCKVLPLSSRFYWKGLDFLDPLTARSVIGAIAIDLLFHSAAIAVYLLFNVC